MPLDSGLDGSPVDSAPPLDAEQASGCGEPMLASGEHTFTLQSANGVTYTYDLVIPDSVDLTKPAPLVVVWHALMSSPEETRDLTTIDAAIAKRGGIAVYPRSPDESWDVGSCCTATAGGVRRDEETFVRELIQEVRQRICVDDRRIFTTGFSNGGMISHMLACNMADVFAAAAPIGSTLTISETDCQPSRPMPVFMVNGTADPLVGYDAPGIAGGVSVSRAFESWAEKNQCVGAPVETFARGAARCMTYQQCAGDVEVTLCTVEGMGHCVPGMKKESDTNCLTKLVFGLLPFALGAPNDDMVGIEAATEFLFSAVK